MILFALLIFILLPLKVVSADGENVWHAITSGSKNDVHSFGWDLSKVSRIEAERSSYNKCTADGARCNPAPQSIKNGCIGAARPIDWEKMLTYKQLVYTSDGCDLNSRWDVLLEYCKRANGENKCVMHFSKCAEPAQMGCE